MSVAEHANGILLNQGYVCGHCGRLKRRGGRGGGELELSQARKEEEK